LKEIIFPLTEKSDINGAKKKQFYEPRMNAEKRGFYLI